eukprot:4667018-Pyramimonas_sp.AAC.1
MVNRARGPSYWAAGRTGLLRPSVIGGGGAAGAWAGAPSTPAGALPHLEADQASREGAKGARPKKGGR